MCGALSVTRLSAGAPRQPPGIRHVVHLVTPPALVTHGHEVEAVFVSGTPVPQSPAQRHSLDQPPLERADRFDGRAAAKRAPRLDLDERDQPTPPNDQIEIVPADAKAMGLYLPPTRHQVAHRRALAGHAAPLPPIGPLPHRYEPPSFRHAPR